MAKAEKTPPIPKQRKSYTLDDKAKAKKYYLIGLSLLEVGKITDTPFRTIEKWYVAENWKDQRETIPIKKKANDLFNSGLNYAQIGKALNKSKSTVSRYLKTVRNENEIN
ncbi:helix-turn-helix domain-containing protein [Flavobacterium sandaracinum]|uniref:Helix-turn-helix domain-containing protein n=1 Tax=Flavobacterium sandaracinum TaxID=2541733 RepID=A0A4R5CNA9_9FLAO|nr:helix-turn-helix domain-containing protein [Flavobacterium sandaracinum]TDE01516.1 helix-turn-helix domain-containing protein [Flavobacterium sandaracinum]